MTVGLIDGLKVNKGSAQSANLAIFHVKQMKDWKFDL